MNRAEEFKQYIGQIKALGYRVFVNPKAYNGITYCVIADGLGRVGNCQLGDFGFGVLFSTIHKMRTGIGAGFGITEWDKPILDIKRHHVESCLAFAPSWVSERDRQRVEKYTLDEWRHSFFGKDYIEYEAED